MNCYLFHFYLWVNHCYRSSWHWIFWTQISCILMVQLQGYSLLKPLVFVHWSLFARLPHCRNLGTHVFSMYLFLLWFNYIVLLFQKVWLDRYLIYRTNIFLGFLLPISFTWANLFHMYLSYFLLKSPCEVVETVVIFIPPKVKFNLRATESSLPKEHIE